ncbi:MAG: DNA polymerase, partial [Patescibacteria group bacterium]
MATKRKKLVVIDGKSVFYRGYYAMGNLATKDGKPTGGVYGFATMALEIIKRLNPDYVCVAWDKPKTNIRKRKELYPAYKANRKPAPADFYEQIPMLHDLLDSFGWPLYELDDYEADDIMGALAVQAKEKDIETILITSDLDMLQLINHHVHVYALKKGLSNIEQFHPESFEEKYGIRVDQFLDLKSLKGDSSDNIPGVPGIGEKTAIILLKEYETLDNIYENLPNIKETVSKKLADGKELAYVSKQLAHIWIDAPVKLDLKALDGRNIKPEKVLELLEELEFKTLARQARDVLNIGEAKLPQSISAGYTGEIIRVNAGNKSEQLSKIIVADNIFVQSRVQDAMGKELSSLILSIDPQKTYIIDRKLLDDSNILEEIFSKKQLLIGFEIKPLIKVLLGRGINLPASFFDIKVAAFLYNSLRSDLTLTSLNKEYLNIEGTELDNLDITELEDTAGEIVQAEHSLYGYFKSEFDKTPKTNKLSKEIEMPMIPLLARMEMKGIALDKDYLRELGDKLTDMISDIEQEVYGYADEEFNLNSPKQLSEILFEKLALPTFGIKKGKTGYSTAAGELNKLKFEHPIIDLLQNYREMSKL